MHKSKPTRALTPKTPPVGVALTERSEVVRGWRRLRAWLPHGWGRLCAGWRKTLPPPRDPRREDRWAIPLVVLLALLVFGPVTARTLLRGPDFVPHTLFALQMQARHHPVAPHFLFHWLDYTLADRLQAWGEPPIVVVDQAVVDRPALAGIIICLLALVVTSLLLYGHFRTVRLRDGRPLPAWLALLLVLAAQLVVPIPLLYFLDPAHQHLYRGYMGINTFHSPTTLLTKPLALLLFCLSYRVVSTPSGTHRWGTIVGLACVTALGFLAKPSFLLAYIPALCVAACVCLLRRKACDWPALFFGLLIPAALLLAWQMYFMYGTPFFDDGLGHGAADGISIRPFCLIGSDPPLLMFLRYLGMTGLAVVTTMAFMRQVWRDPQLQLALLTAAIGLTMSTCLIETGPRMGHGNFLWTAQLTLFVLMAITLRFVVQHCALNEETTRVEYARRIAVFVVLGLHLAVGILWYTLHLLHAPAMQWW